MADISSPLCVKRVSFNNRIVMAPMVRFGFPCRNGVMGEKLLREYLDRADKGIGLLISQVLSVSPEQEIAGGAGVTSEAHVGYLRTIATACHAHGSRFFAQLWVPGFGFYEAASLDVNALSGQALAKIRDDFIRSAVLCREAGLDGVELHGAHTFFLNMMASGASNRRQDKYGGDLEGRLTLVREIREGIGDAADEDFIVSYRMGWGDSLETDARTARALEKIGIDMLHVSTGIPEDRKLELPPSFPCNEVVYTGCCVKKQVGIPVIAVNGIRTLARGNALIEEGDCDFVAYGRPFLADAAFVPHSRQDMTYKPCFECRRCRWFTDGEACPARRSAKRRQG